MFKNCLLTSILDNLDKKNFQIFIYHIKHLYSETIKNEIKELDLLKEQNSF